MQEEYYQATRRGKVNFLLCLLASAALYILLKYIWAEYLPAPIETTDESVKLFTRDVSIAILCLGIITLIFYLYISRALYNYSIRIKENKQYPPPNSNIPFKQKILRGEKAIKHANNLFYTSFVLIFLGVLKLGAGIYIAYFLYNI